MKPKPLQKSVFCQNLESQGAPFVIRPPQKFRGGSDPRPSYANSQPSSKTEPFTMKPLATRHDPFSFLCRPELLSRLFLHLPKLQQKLNIWQDSKSEAKRTNFTQVQIDAMEREFNDCI